MLVLLLCTGSVGTGSLRDMCVRMCTCVAGVVQHAAQREAFVICCRMQLLLDAAA
jgi:hypothetical protein